MSFTLPEGATPQVRTAPTKMVAAGEAPVDSETVSHETAQTESGRLLSLARCHEILMRPENLGARAPSLVTLKRWSAAGDLESAIRRPPGRRQVYDLATVRDTCMQRLPERFEVPRHLPNQVPMRDTGESAVATPDEIPMADVDHPQLEALHERVLPPPGTDVLQDMDARLSHLTIAVGTIESQLSRILIELGALDSARKALMLRGDGEATALRQHIASLQAQLARAGLMPANPAMPLQGQGPAPLLKPP